MKKNLFIVIPLCLLCGPVWSQSKAEIMLQQIADLEISLKTIKTSYQHTQQGLSNLNGLKNGNYNLHSDYFGSLKDVSPAVRNDSRLPEITKDQQAIITLFQNEIAWQQQQAILSSDEITYLQKIGDNIIVQCNKDLDELNLAVNVGTQMTDRERLKRIDKIYAATIDKYQFSQSFVYKSRALALDRRDNKQQSQSIRKLYDLN